MSVSKRIDEVQVDLAAGLDGYSEYTVDEIKCMSHADLSLTLMNQRDLLIKQIKDNSDEALSVMMRVKENLSHES